jgi:hypothetical protein
MGKLESMNSTITGFGGTKVQGLKKGTLRWLSLPYESATCGTSHQDENIEGRNDLQE